MNLGSPSIDHPRLKFGGYAQCMLDGSATYVLGTKERGRREGWTMHISVLLPATISGKKATLTCRPGVRVTHGDDITSGVQNWQPLDFEVRITAAAWRARREDALNGL